jgi:multiple sugar transport system substrate-binding protein
MPDVVMCSVVPDMLTEGYFQDVGDIASKDPDWTDLPDSVEASCHFGDGIYTVPCALNISGIFVNDDLFDAANVDQLEPGFTKEDILDAAKKLTNPSQQILGLNVVAYFPDWLPSLFDDSLGQYSYDGENFNLDSRAFNEAIKYCNQITKGKYSFDSLSDKEKKIYKAEGWWDVWPQGKIAMQYDYSWSLPDYLGSADTINSRFIGMPDGQCIIYPDYMGISASCKYPEVAFGFIKWMTFGKEGQLNRVSLRDDKDYFYESLPINTNPEVLDAYFANSYPGLEEAFSHIDTAMVEGETWIPGWVNALYDGQTGLSITTNGEKIDNATMRVIIPACMRGDINVADYADQMNAFANDTIAKAKQNMEAALK